VPTNTKPALAAQFAQNALTRVANAEATQAAATATAVAEGAAAEVNAAAGGGKDDEVRAGDDGQVRHSPPNLNKT